MWPNPGPFSAFFLAELIQLSMSSSLKHFFHLASKTRLSFLSPSTGPSPPALLVPPALPYLQMLQCPVMVRYLSSSPTSHSLDPVSGLLSIRYFLMTTTCISVAHNSTQMSNRHLKLNMSRPNFWYPHLTYFPSR